MEPDTKLVYKPLVTPETIDEGACLLRDYSLPSIEEVKAETVVFLYYSLSRKHKIKGEKEDKDNEDDESADEDESADGDCEKYSLLALKKLYNGQGKMEIGPKHFLERDGIRVIEFIGCSSKVAQEFLNTIAETMRWPNPPPTKGPQSVLDSINLNKTGHYITGTSLRAAFKPQKFLSLFVSIPYMGLGKQGGEDGSVTLNQYRFLGSALQADGGSSGGSGEILVHQAWFFIFDNETIAIFKSADDEFSDRAPLFPYQERLGGFQALAQMISNTITSSETTPLRKFRKKVSKLELQVQNETKKDRDPINIDSAKVLILEFDKCITDISTMMDVVQSQVQIIEDLRKIFQNSFKEVVGRLRPYSNAVKIPYIFGEREQIRAALETIDIVVEERKAFHAELDIWLKDLRRSQILSFQDSHTLTAKESLDQVRDMQNLLKDAHTLTAKESIEQAKEMNRAIKEQGQTSLEQAKEMNQAIKEQGQTISVFTLITSVFLPLGFFAAYFAIYPPSLHIPITPQSQFWVITGTITFVITLLMSCFLFRNDDSIKKWLTDPIRNTFRSSEDIKTELEAV